MPCCSESVERSTMYLRAGADRSGIRLYESLYGSVGLVNDQRLEPPWPAGRAFRR